MITSGPLVNGFLHKAGKDELQGLADQLPPIPYKKDFFYTQNIIVKLRNGYQD